MLSNTLVSSKLLVVLGLNEDLGYFAVASVNL